MARPSKLTPAVRARLLEASRLGLTRKLAAAYAGVDVSTVYRYLEKGRKARRGQFREFYDAVKRAESEGAAESMQVIGDAARGSKTVVQCPECESDVELVRPGQWTAAAWILERRHGYRKGGPAEAELEEEAAREVLPLDEGAVLRATLEQIRKATAAAVSAGSWQAVFAGQRLALQTFRELAELTRTENPGVDDLDPEAFEEARQLELEQWPDQYLERAIRTYEERHGLRLLGLLEGGRS